MGDRCYMNLTVRRRDVRRFAELTPDLIEPDEPAEDVDIEQVNYAAWTELESAADQRLVFRGWHSTGGEYPAASFASDGTDGLLHSCINTEQSTRPHVPLDENGQPMAGELKAALAFLRADRRARELIAEKEAK
jgi:hypothetical protein